MKYLYYTLIALNLISCGSNQEKKDEASTEANKQIITKEIEVTQVDKNWKEFEVFALGNTMAEMKFDIKSISVNQGDWVRIKLVNNGIDAAMIHNIVFVKYGTRKEVATQSMNAGPDQKYVAKGPNVIAYSDLANPGETVTLEFEAPKKGNYEFICTYPGHAEMMRGYFFVK